MVEGQVKELGVKVTKIGPSYFCQYGEALGSGVVAYNSNTAGVAVFSVKDGKQGVQTPEGIKVGSALADVRRAYPELKNSNGDSTFETGNNIAAVPGNTKAHFLFLFDGGKVTEIDLLSVDQDCV
jgi:hypothetical protein